MQPRIDHKRYPPIQRRAKKITLSSVTHVPLGLMGCALAALGWWVGGKREIQPCWNFFAPCCTWGFNEFVYILVQNYPCSEGTSPPVITQADKELPLMMKVNGSCAPFKLYKASRPCSYGPPCPFCRLFLKA